MNWESRNAGKIWDNSKPGYRVGRFPDSLVFRHVGKDGIGRHSGAEFIVPILQANLHSKDLANSIFNRLHVARGEFCLAIDLLDGSGKIFTWK